MPDAMKYSQSEKFSWLKSAALLDKTNMIVESLEQLDQGCQETFYAGKMPKELRIKLHELCDAEYAKVVISIINSNSKEIRGFCKVRQSRFAG
jgi:hypothetical protein